MTNKEEEEMANMQEVIYHFVAQHVVELKSDPVLVAAALAATAMGLYKSILSPDEYDQMINVMSDNRDIIKPFPLAAPTQTGSLH